MMEKLNPCRYKIDEICVKPFSTGYRRDFRCETIGTCCLFCSKQLQMSKDIDLDNYFQKHIPTIYECSTRCRTYG